jgi:hypothetical protein
VGSRWLPVVATATLALVVLSRAVPAAEEGQTCVLITEHEKKADQQSTSLDAIMAGLGGAGSVAVLIVEARAHWLIKAAAVAGVTNAVWNIAKAYAGTGTDTQERDKDTQVCVTRSAPGQAASTVSIGPAETVGEAGKEFQDYLGSALGKTQWQQLALGTKVDVSKFDLHWQPKLVDLPQTQLPTDWPGTAVSPQAGADYHWPTTPQMERRKLPTEITTARSRAKEAAEKARAVTPMVREAIAKALSARQAALEGQRRSLASGKHRPNGYGTSIWANGDRYEGDRRDGLPNGYGVYTYANGDRYEGEYLNGQRDGYGVLSLHYGEQYEGQFRDGKRNGYGTNTWPDGARFEGEHRDGKSNGYGVHSWLGGHRHEGEERDSRANGYGVDTWPDGHRYEGEYRNGEWNGWGYELQANGTAIMGYWDNSQLVRPATAQQ